MEEYEKNPSHLKHKFMSSIWISKSEHCKPKPDCIAKGILSELSSDYSVQFYSEKENDIPLHLDKSTWRRNEELKMKFINEDTKTLKIVMIILEKNIKYHSKPSIRIDCLLINF